MWLFLTPNNNNYEGHCDSTSQVQSLGGGGGGGGGGLHGCGIGHIPMQIPN